MSSVNLILDSLVSRGLTPAFSYDSVSTGSSFKDKQTSAHNKCLKDAKVLRLIDGICKIKDVYGHQIPYLRSLSKPIGASAIGVLRHFQEWRGDTGLYHVCKYAGRTDCSLEGFRDDVSGRDFALGLVTDSMFLVSLYCESIRRKRR